jgi:hypothetical protein
MFSYGTSLCFSDQVNSLLEAEKFNTGTLNEQLGKAINEKNKLMT